MLLEAVDHSGWLLARVMQATGKERSTSRTIVLRAKGNVQPPEIQVLPISKMVMSITSYLVVCREAEP